MIAQILRELIAAGLQGESLVAAVERIEQAQPKAFDATAERRRAKDRERYRIRRKPPPPPKSTETTETTETEKEALSLSSTSSFLGLSTSKKEERKKERARKSLLPDDWQPNAKHYAKGERAYVDQKAEDMRNWAKSKAIMRADWDATFHGFLRPRENGFGGRHEKPSAADRAIEFARRAREIELAQGIGRPSDAIGGDRGSLQIIESVSKFEKFG